MMIDVTKENKISRFRVVNQRKDGHIMATAHDIIHKPNFIWRELHMAGVHGYVKRDAKTGMLAIHTTNKDREKLEKFLADFFGKWPMGAERITVFFKGELQDE